MTQWGSMNKFIIRNSVIKRIIITYIAYFCLPMFFFGGLSYAQHVQSARQSLDQKLINKRNAIVTDINYAVEQMSTVSKTISNNTMIIDYLENYSGNPQK
jgi:sensor domain CHASE-containing protein